MTEKLIAKITSRKFWIGVALIVIGVIVYATGDQVHGWELIAIGGGGYLGLETVIDILAPWISSKISNGTEEE